MVGSGATNRGVMAEIRRRDHHGAARGVRNVRDDALGAAQAAVPLSQLVAASHVDDQQPLQAIASWQYWTSQGYQFG
jgi:hypothetical protein